MAEYIEREATKKSLRGLISDCRRRNVNPVQIRALLYALDLIEEVSAADVVEVKHGEWSYEYSGDKLGGTDATYDYRCSVCDEFALEESNYCPNCGAKMDGERKCNDA